MRESANESDERRKERERGRKSRQELGERGRCGMDVHHLALHSAALLRRRFLVLDAFSFLALTPYSSFFFHHRLSFHSLCSSLTLSLLFSYSLSLSLSLSFSHSLSRRRLSRMNPEALGLRNVAGSSDCELARIAGYEERVRFTLSSRKGVVVGVHGCFLLSSFALAVSLRPGNATCSRTSSLELPAARSCDPNELCDSHLAPSCWPSSSSGRIKSPFGIRTVVPGLS